MSIIWTTTNDRGFTAMLEHILLRVTRAGAGYRYIVGPFTGTAPTAAEAMRAADQAAYKVLLAHA